MLRFDYFFADHARLKLPISARPLLVKLDYTRFN